MCTLNKKWDKPTSECWCHVKKIKPFVLVINIVFRKFIIIIIMVQFDTGKNIEQWFSVVHTKM